MINKAEKSLFELIKSINKRPAMYGINKVEDIQLIILGYYFNSTEDNYNNFNDEFKIFANKEFEIAGDNDWSGLIRFPSASDQHSIELFSNLFLKFLAVKNVIVS